MIENAVIKKALIDTSNYGVPTLILELSFAGSAYQSFGPYQLYRTKNWKTDANICGHYIARVMSVAGVGEWGKLPGRNVRVRRRDDRLIDAIGHIVDDNWFEPKKECEGVKG